MSAQNAAPDSNLPALSGLTPSTNRGFGSSKDEVEVTRFVRFSVVFTLDSATRADSVVVFTFPL